MILCTIGKPYRRPGTLIAERYIGEVLKEEFFRTPARVLEKRVFWDNRIVSDSLPGLSGLADKEVAGAAGGGEGDDGGSALERGWKERVREWVEPRAID